MDELEPCRACGSEPKLLADGPHGPGQDYDYYVGCPKCGARGPKFAVGWEGTIDQVKVKAIEAWNSFSSK